MARALIASFNVADSSASEQLLTTGQSRVASIKLKAREGNTGAVYIADDSAAKSEGFQLLGGDSTNWTFSPATVKGASFWVWGADSGDRLDYTVLLED